MELSSLTRNNFLKFQKQNEWDSRQKPMEKTPKVFLRKPKQIRMKLHGNK